MSDRPRAGRSDGVTIAPGASRGKSLVLLAGAVALACVALLVLFGRPEPRAPEVAAAPTPVAEASPEPAAPAAAATPPVASALPKAPPPPEPEELAAVAAAEAAEPEPESAPEPSLDETPSGIGLFPPPGTEPLKIGIVVPDDFELPEGYLRHYQASDDGQEYEPILLFHPDYEVLGDDGQPIELPPDRIVPPSLAPPGMPIRMLEQKKPRDEGP